MGFPGSSAGKEFACNAGDPGSIPGSGRSTGEGISYPLQYSWASLVAHMVKNLSAMWDTWVRSLGWGDPLEKGIATLSSILAWRVPWTEEPGRLQSMGSQRVGHDWVTFSSLGWGPLTCILVSSQVVISHSPWCDGKGYLITEYICNTVWFKILLI